MSNVEMFKYEWIYRKSKATNFLNAKKNPLKYHENVCVFGFGQVVYYPQFTCGAPYKKVHRSDNKDDCAYGKSTRSFGDVTENCGFRFPSSITDVFSNPSGRGQLHPTQKPVALLEYLIKTYTIENETVLDNCAGSMSTAIACINTNRKGIMIEKDKEYFNIGCERIKRHILDNGGFDSTGK